MNKITFPPLTCAVAGRREEKDKIQNWMIGVVENEQVLRIRMFNKLSFLIYDSRAFLLSLLPPIDRFKKKGLRVIPQQVTFD